MIQGEFLVCDDLGPLGRLVSPGEFLPMDPPAESGVGAGFSDLVMVRTERQWVGAQYEKADAEAERYRRALRTAHLGGEGKRERVREWFEVWTIEAAKYALCDHWLLVIIGKLESGESTGMNVPKDFSWEGFGPIRSMKARLFDAADREIAEGARFRAQ